MKHLHVVGAGMDPGNDLTLLGVCSLQKSQHVLVITGDFERACKVLKQIGTSASIEDMMVLYRDGELDILNYQRIAQRIVACCNKYDHVSVLVNGHPLVGVSWWKHLGSDKAMSNVQIEYVEAVSSALSVFCAIRRDPIEHGVTVVDVNRLLLFNYSVATDIDLLILDICSVGTRRTHLSNPAVNNKWEALCDYLDARYPADHQCYLVFLSMNPDFPCQKTRVTIKELRASLGQLHFGTTLLIPALPPSQVSVEFLSSLLETGCNAA